MCTVDLDHTATAEVLWKNLVFCLLQRKCKAPDEDTNVSEGAVS